MKSGLIPSVREYKIKQEIGCRRGDIVILVVSGERMFIGQQV